MNKMPKISIVTPSYNQGEYIERTITSILNQDYPDFEYIVMDGGSDDETINILKKYEDRLIWQSERDKGQTDAINKALKLVTGDIFCYVNSDDMLMPDALKKVANKYQERPESGLIYGYGYFGDKSDNFIEPYFNEPFNMDKFLDLNFMCQPAVFFTRKAYNAVGAAFDDSFHHVMDYDMWIRIGKQFHVECIPEYLAMLRIYPECKTNADRINVNREAIQLMKREFPEKVSSWWIYSIAGAITEEERMDAPRNTSSVHEKKYARNFIFWAVWSFIKYYQRIPKKDILFLREQIKYYFSIK